MIAATRQHQQETALRLWQHAAIFLFVCAAIILRRPDGVFHAQFFAEDGHVWYAEAYNFGWWSALFRTYVGYFVVLPRLAASIALLVPLSLVPLTLNLIAIPIQALPVNLLLSSRSSAWGSLRFRALLAGAYLLLPNCYELLLGITDANWLLVLSAFILLVGSVPQGVAAKFLDISVLLLTGLTGPFSLFLFPISVFLAWKNRNRWRWVQAGILVFTLLIQVRALLTGAAVSRPHFALGATPALFTRMVGSQIFLGTLLGSNQISLIPGEGFFVFLLCATAVGATLMVVCFSSSSLEMKLFLLFSGMVLGASLIAPTVQPPPGASVWEVLAATSGIRYWFFPGLAFAWTLISCCRSRSSLLKYTSAALLFLMCIGIIRDWRLTPLPDEHLPQYVRLFESAPAGVTVTIPLYPGGWTMKLVKHPPSR